MNETVPGRMHAIYITDCGFLSTEQSETKPSSHPNQIATTARSFVRSFVHHSQNTYIPPLSLSLSLSLHPSIHPPIPSSNNGSNSHTIAILKSNPIQSYYVISRNPSLPPSPNQSINQPLPSLPLPSLPLPSPLLHKRRSPQRANAHMAERTSAMGNLLPSSSLLQQLRKCPVRC